MSSSFTWTTNSWLPDHFHIYAIDSKHCKRWETFKDLIMLVMTTTEVFYGNTDAQDVAREVELAAKKSPLNMRRHHHHIKQQTCIGYSCAFEYFNVFRN
jgi:hypothetical protein